MTHQQTCTAGLQKQDSLQGHRSLDSGTQLPARGSQGHRRCLQWRTSSSEHGGARPLTTAATVITMAAERSWEVAPEEKASLVSCLSLSLVQRTGCGQMSTCLRVTKEPAGREIKGRRCVQSGGAPRQAWALRGGLESEGLSQAYQSGEEGLVLPPQGRTGPGHPGQVPCREQLGPQPSA